MDDDGIVLNLVVTSAKPRQRVEVKGGRWTDRAKAKRKSIPSNTRVAREEPRQSKVTFAEVDESPRPSKKPRTDQTKDSTVSNPSAKRPQIVSSLFTSNPEIKAAPALQTIPRHVDPSNAPLTDKSTFAGLGLDPLIVSHLESKMNITKPTSVQRDALPPLLSVAPEFTSRDAFIQSQTGSGKTLAFLLPILQDLLPLSSLSYIDRTIGTLAIIVAPTRELAKQISDVLELLIQLRLRPKDDSGEDASSQRLTRWLVSGLFVGGSTRSHEKARIRKGLPILVSTPGRLLDHLQNTSSFNVGKCRWLVLDEADRLMELGFEESIKGILNALDGRRKLAIQAMNEGKSMEVGGWDWSRERRTVLCSATMREDVQQLAGTALKNPIVIKASSVDKHLEQPIVDADSTTATVMPLEKFTPPSQLSQKYVVVPLKLRLVALVALLRSLISQSNPRQGVQIIVFLSCTDSVDYHWKLLGSSAIDEGDNGNESGNDSSDEDGDEKDGTRKGRSSVEDPVSVTSPLLPNTAIFRLHGSLPLQTRMSSLKGFSSKPSPSTSFKPSVSGPQSSILLSTSVASRGLDLPLVRFVIQYDLPTEGGATEYVHRVGRTARAGRGGEAWSFVAPSESGWVEWVEDGMRSKEVEGESEKPTGLIPVSVESVLKEGFGGKGGEHEDRATQVQLTFERWVLKSKENGTLARSAFQSHMRAYATHPSDEKHIFHVKHLHIGHMAKAFALREAPSQIGHGQGKKDKQGKSKDKGKDRYDARSRANEIRAEGASGSRMKQKPSQRRVGEYDSDDDASTEKRMRDTVRKQGKLSKKGGVMMSSGTSEFQVAGLDELERLVSGK